MDANSTVFRHWDDVVFENRNKSYGAYLLRRAYANRLLAGLGVTVIMVTVVLSLHNMQKQTEDRRKKEPPFIAEGRQLQPPPILEAKPKRVVNPPRQPRNSNTTILVTRAEVETVEPIEDGVEYISDDEFGSGDLGMPEGLGNIGLPEPEAIELPPVLDFAEVMPQYEGGLEAMMKFIQKKIRYPRAPKQMGIDGTVIVRFVVNGDGSISDVQVLRGVHPDYDKEAVRVISMLPSWKGGSHNGRPVAVRMVLPIRFSLK